MFANKVPGVFVCIVHSNAIISAQTSQLLTSQSAHPTHLLCMQDKGERYIMHGALTRPTHPPNPAVLCMHIKQSVKCTCSHPSTHPSQPPAHRATSLSTRLTSTTQPHPHPTWGEHMTGSSLACVTQTTTPKKG